ncbi:MAG: porin family protein [Caulobacteraceae bacterium]|nr:porin family protein [Caulobacteraceae bacterium]
MIRNILAACAVIALASPVMAQTGTDTRGYGNLGYTHLEGDTPSVGAVTGRLGVDLNRWMAFETEASIGVKKNEFEVAGFEGTNRHQWDAAGYLVGKMPIGDQINVFARGGYGHTELTRTVAGSETDIGGDSWNYGAGAEFLLHGQTGLRADWTRRDFRQGDVKANAYSLSLVQRF